MSVNRNVTVPVGKADIRYQSSFRPRHYNAPEPWEATFPEPPVEFGAPGIDVLVAWDDGGWITATGNSFAAPHMTGIVALILAKHPGLTPFLVKTILHATARNVGHAAPEDPPAAAPGD